MWKMWMLATGASDSGPWPHRAAQRRVFPELMTEEQEADEERVYGAAPELVVDWREAWAERKAARHTLA